MVKDKPLVALIVMFFFTIIVPPTVTGEDKNRFDCVSWFTHSALLRAGYVIGYLDALQGRQILLAAIKVQLSDRGGPRSTLTYLQSEIRKLDQKGIRPAQISDQVDLFCQQPKNQHLHPSFLVEAALTLVNGTKTEEEIEEDLLIFRRGGL